MVAYWQVKPGVRGRVSNNKTSRQEILRTYLAWSVSNRQCDRSVSTLVVVRSWMVFRATGRTIKAGNWKIYSDNFIYLMSYSSNCHSIWCT